MGLNILVVDDEAELVEFYVECLEFGGHSVVGTASNGAAALTLFECLFRHSITPDLVLMDHRMPEMSGLEAARAIRRLSPHTPVLLATADGSIRDTALELGGVRVARKPFTVRQLLDGVEALEPPH